MPFSNGSKSGVSSSSFVSTAASAVVDDMYNGVDFVCSKVHDADVWGVHEVINFGLDKGLDKGAGLKENDHAVEVLTRTRATDNAATRRDLIAMVDRVDSARIENYESWIRAVC